MDLEWDPEKEKINITKHGVSFSEAMTVFGDPLELTIADPGHSEGEYHFISIGLTSTNQLLVVSYTERDERIRIISAWPATPGERKQYESGT